MDPGTKRLLELTTNDNNTNRTDVVEEIINIISGITSESNTVISKFKTLKLQLPSAKESQAALQLYNEYCTKNKCLQCAVGHQLLNRKP